MRIIILTFAVFVVVLVSMPSCCSAFEVNLAVEVVERESYQTINDFDYYVLSGKSGKVAGAYTDRNERNAFVRYFTPEHVFKNYQSFWFGTIGMISFINLL